MSALEAFESRSLRFPRDLSQRHGRNRHRNGRTRLRVLRRKIVCTNPLSFNRGLARRVTEPPPDFRCSPVPPIGEAIEKRIRAIERRAALGSQDMELASMSTADRCATISEIPAGRGLPEPGQ